MKPRITITKKKLDKLSLVCHKVTRKVHSSIIVDWQCKSLLVLSNVIFSVNSPIMFSSVPMLKSIYKVDRIQ